MRRTFFFAVAAILCCFQAVIPANAQDAKLLSLLDGKNKLIDAAVLKGDLSPVLDLFSPQATIVNPVGALLHREDLANALKSGELKYTSIRDSDQKLAQFGDVALFSYVSDQAGTMQGHNISAKCRFTEVWARKSGQWKMVAVQITPVLPQPQ